MVARFVTCRRHPRNPPGNVPLCTLRVSALRSPTLSLQHPRLSPIFRIFFQVPYPATPLFATLTKTAEVCTNNSHSGSPRAKRVHCAPHVFGADRNSSRFPRRSERPNVRTFKRSTCSDLSSFLSNSCSLFCAFLHSFAFIKNPTHLFSSSSALFAQKHPGWGYPRNLRQGSGISPTKQKQTRAVLHDRFSTSAVLSVVSSRPWPCSSAHPATSARPANPNQEGCTRD